MADKKPKKTYTLNNFAKKELRKQELGIKEKPIAEKVGEGLGDNTALLNQGLQNVSFSNRPVNTTTFEPPATQQNVTQQPEQQTETTGQQQNYLLNYGNSGLPNSEVSTLLGSVLTGQTQQNLYDNVSHSLNKIKEGAELFDPNVGLTPGNAFAGIKFMNGLAGLSFLPITAVNEVLKQNPVTDWLNKGAMLPFELADELYTLTQKGTDYAFEKITGNKPDRNNPLSQELDEFVRTANQLLIGGKTFHETGKFFKKGIPEVPEIKQMSYDEYKKSYEKEPQLININLPEFQQFRENNPTLLLSEKAGADFYATPDGQIITLTDYEKPAKNVTNGMTQEEIKLSQKNISGKKLTAQEQSKINSQVTSNTETTENTTTEKKPYEQPATIIGEQPKESPEIDLGNKKQTFAKIINEFDKDLQNIEQKLSSGEITKQEFDALEKQYNETESKKKNWEKRLEDLKEEPKPIETVTENKRVNEDDIYSPGNIKNPKYPDRTNKAVEENPKYLAEGKDMDIYEGVSDEKIKKIEDKYPDAILVENNRDGSYTLVGKNAEKESIKDFKDEKTFMNWGTQKYKQSGGSADYPQILEIENSKVTEVVPETNQAETPKISLPKAEFENAKEITEKLQPEKSKLEADLKVENTAKLPEPKQDAVEKVEGGSKLKKVGDKITYKGEEGEIIKVYPQDELDKKQGYQSYRIRTESGERDIDAKMLEQKTPISKNIKINTPLLNLKNTREKSYYEGVSYHNGEPVVEVSYIFNDGGKLKQDTKFIPYDKFEEKYHPLKNENEFKKVNRALRDAEKIETVKLGGLTETEKLKREQDKNILIEKTIGRKLIEPKTKQESVDKEAVNKEKEPYKMADEELIKYTEDKILNDFKKSSNKDDAQDNFNRNKVKTYGDMLQYYADAEKKRGRTVPKEIMDFVPRDKEGIRQLRIQEIKQQFGKNIPEEVLKDYPELKTTRPESKLTPEKPVGPPTLEQKKQARKKQIAEKKDTGQEAKIPIDTKVKGENLLQQINKAIEDVKEVDINKETPTAIASKLKKLGYEIDAVKSGEFDESFQAMRNRQTTEKDFKEKQFPRTDKLNQTPTYATIPSKDLSRSLRKVGIGEPRIVFKDANGTYKIPIEKLSEFKTKLEKAKIYDKAKQTIKSALSKDSGISFGGLSKLGDLADPKVLKAVYDVANYHISKGIKKFGDFARKMIKEIGDWIKPHLRSLWDELNKNRTGIDNIVTSGINTIKKIKDLPKEFKGIANTNEFKEWFKDSKVRDENGNPIQLYSGHSNVELYGEYNPKKSTAGGFYATENPEVASGYALSKFGSKEGYENGSQYRIKGKNGKYNKKLYQYELSENQKKIIDELKNEQNEYGDYDFHLKDMERYIAEHSKYDADVRRWGDTGGIYNLRNIYEFNEQMGYNIAYDKQGKEPRFMRQQENDTELIMNRLGIDWNSYDWEKPGTFPVYLNIKNPIDADKPFPADLLKALEDKAKYERYRAEGELHYSNWTNDYPLREWVKDIKDDNEGWSTQIPKNALPIIKSFGYDGIKERGMKATGLSREERSINWIAFDKEQILNKFDYNYLKALKSLQEKINRPNMTFGLDTLPEVYTIAKYHTGKFAEWSKKVIKDVGNWIKPHLRNLYNEITKDRTGLDNVVAQGINLNPIKKEVSETFEGAVDKIKRSADTIKKILAPVSRGENAKLTAKIITEKNAELARQEAIMTENFKEARKVFDKRSNAENLKMIDAIESGADINNPIEKSFANEVRKLLDAEYKKVTDRKGVKSFIENYFPHIWERDSQNQLQAMLSRRPFEGSKSFLKKRTIPTTREGIEAGLKPVTYNPVDLALLKLHEMKKFNMAHEIMDNLKAEGLVKYIPADYFAPAGWTKLNDKIGTIFGDPGITATEYVDKHLYNALQKLATDLNIKHSRVAELRGTRMGEASPAGYVNTKYATPEDVLAHEIGHHLQFKYNLWDYLTGDIHVEGRNKTDTLKKTRQERVKIHKELRALADLRAKGEKVSDSHKRYLREKDEKMAVVLQAYTHIPAEMREVAPTIFSKFEKFIDSKPQLQQIKQIKPSLVPKGMDMKYDKNGILIKGHYYLPEPATRIINNHLSPGLKGEPIFDIYRGISNTLNQVQLGASLFHASFTSGDANLSKLALGLMKISRGKKEGFLDIATSPIAFITNPVEGNKIRKDYLSDRPNNPELVNAITRAGGRISMDRFYTNDLYNTVKKAFKDGKYISGSLKSPFAMFEVLSKPVLEYLVPRQKLGVFSGLAKDILQDEAKGKLTKDQATERLQEAWRSVDNRMGQLVYDNLYWDHVVKDIAMASVRSVGWNLGTFRELGGGIRDIPKIITEKRLTPRTAYALALPIGIGLLGAVYSYLNGTPAESIKDLYFPRTGHKNKDGVDDRISLPSYMKDVFAYGTDIKSALNTRDLGTGAKTLSHKMHPAISMLLDLINNHDYFGNEISDNTPFSPEWFVDEAKYIAKQFRPFTVNNISEMNKQGESLSKQLQSFFGFQLAPGYIRRSDMQNRIYDTYQKRNGEKIISKPEAETRELKRELKDLYLKDKNAYDEKIADLLEEGKISSRELNSIESDKPTDIKLFKYLPADDKIELWNQMNKEEKQRYQDGLTNKIRKTLNLPYKIPSNAPKGIIEKATPEQYTEYENEAEKRIMQFEKDNKGMDKDELQKQRNRIRKDIREEMNLETEKEKKKTHLYIPGQQNYFNQPKTFKNHLTIPK